MLVNIFTNFTIYHLPFTKIKNAQNPTRNPHQIQQHSSRIRPM